MQHRSCFQKGGVAFLFCAISVLLLLSGCGTFYSQGDQRKAINPGQLDQVTRQHDNSMNQPTTSPRTLARQEDRTARNQNPNLTVGRQSIRNYGVDEQQLTMIAKSVPGVENARVSISGGNAYVTLDMVANVTADQARTIQQQVITALLQKAPRYDYHMTSNDGVHR